MSALYVRQTFEQWAQSVSVQTGVQFYNTVNETPTPSDPTWWTAEFIADEISGDTFCAPGYMESGTVYAIIIARAGLGYADAIGALEETVRALMDRVDTTNRLKWQSNQPVFEDSDGSADADYRVGAPLLYKLDL